MSKSNFVQRGMASFALLATALCANLAIAQTAANRPQDAAPEFPQTADAWINGGPISVETLAGKAVFLWFYEEGCPRCREKWPSLLAAAKKYEGKPVFFMAVNSGNPRPAVQSYAQQNHIPWPIIVDSTRAYERLCDVGEISLKNIHQVKLITADGRMRDGNWSDIEQSVDAALQGAKWKVEPTGVPQSLRGAWMAVEFGDYASAAKNIKKGLTSTKPDMKQGAEALQAVVQGEIDAQLSLAKEALDGERKWEAYRLYQAAAQRFAGYDLPDDVTTIRKDLSAAPEIKAGLLATKNLDAARKLIATGNASSKKRVTTMLEKIVSDVPGTDLAAEAQELLAQITQ